MTTSEPIPTPPPGAGPGDAQVDIAAVALDQSHDLIVVLDGGGTIVLANAAWQAGLDRRGLTSADAGCGINYFDVCEQSDASTVSAGIRAVLCGERPRFEFEYPCHSSTEDAWYSLEVVPLPDPASGVVVTHTNITSRLIGTRQHRHTRDVEPVTMLATTPSGVTGLARMLAEAQSHENSLAVVTITMTDLVDIESRHGRRTRDALVVQVVARVLRLTRADDAMIRPATNQLVLFAAVADAHGAEFLRRKIADVLEADYFVGPAHIEAHVSVTVTSSDQFSTLDSLLNGFSATTERLPPNERQTEQKDDVAADDDTDGAATDDIQASVVSNVPLVVYSLPDGFLQAANAAARSLFGLTAIGADRLHARDIADPVDLRNTTAALSALSSGATDSYRARRTLMTSDGPLDLSTSVRRLLVGAGALAVVLGAPVDTEDTDGPTAEESFAAALVAGTIDAQGVISSVSSAGTPMEATLVGALSETLRLAAHPDEVDLVDTMLETMRQRGSASGEFRVPHAEQGWVDCQCLVFTIKRHVDRGANADTVVVTPDSYAFVVSASVSTKSMVDKIRRLETHIRRIGSEVHAADLALTVRASTAEGVSTVLDTLCLTTRQRDIVERLARGQRVPSIATALFISRSTVRNHLAQVYRIVGVHSQEELLNALRVA
jgi:DNA-binding CsgD family transcriptional regulator/PAS domain-containing protein